MATMNVSLPAAMKDWVEGRTETGRYSNSSDYVRDLIRRDQEREARIKAMQTLIDEAIEGGESDLSVEEIFDSIRQRARENAGP